MNLKRIFIFLSLLVLLSISGGYLIYQQNLETPLDLPEDGLVFEVVKGEVLSSVLVKLNKQGIVQQPWVARVYAAQHNLASKVRVGEFLLTSGLTIPGLFERLTSNSQIKHKVTIVEGSTFEEALAVVKRLDNIEHVLGEASAESVYERLSGKPIESPKAYEGMLYPDTYYYHKGATDLSILKRAYTRLHTVLEQEWQQRAPDLPLKNSYQALILASIVEKETGHPDEREQIAGVFIRRLQKGMRLQTDPTVIYGLGKRYEGNIKREHLLEKTAYNTYRINGLPPTPIALVGRAAIHASLHPDKGTTLYFVAKGDGTHQFSDTIEQHNRAVRKFQLKRRSDYRSSL